MMRTMLRMLEYAFQELLRRARTVLLVREAWAFMWMMLRMLENVFEVILETGKTMVWLKTCGQAC